MGFLYGENMVSGGGKCVDTAHIRQKCGRDAHAAIGLLIIFKHSNQGAPDRKAGTVQRMDELRRFFAFRAEARVHPARLEVPAVGAGRNFAIGILAGEPYFKVIGFAG